MKLTYEIKTQNQMDGRRWDVVKTDNRLDVVNALGRAFTPVDAKEQAAKHPGKFRYIQQRCAIKVTPIEE